MPNEPPRSTLYRGPKNTSEYSRYGNAAKPGYPWKSVSTHSHTSPISWWTPSGDAPSGYAPTDAAFLFALVRRKLRTGHDAATAIASVTADVVAVAPGSRLNLLLTDGRQVAATTYGHSLSVRHGDGAVVVASEPLDDSDSWQPVPDHRLLTATAEKVDVRPL